MNGPITTLCLEKLQTIKYPGKGRMGVKGGSFGKQCFPTPFFFYLAMRLVITAKYSDGEAAQEDSKQMCVRMFTWIPYGLE